MNQEHTVDKLTWLTEAIKKRQESFQSSVRFYRRYHWIQTISTVLLSSAVTLIAGWKPTPNFHTDPNNIILVLGGLVTMISAWGGLFSHKESWLIYANTLNRLRALQAKIQFLQASPNPLNSGDDLVKSLYDEYQSILDAHNQAWLQIRSIPTKKTAGEESLGQPASK